jgi:hypothetical protein
MSDTSRNPRSDVPDEGARAGGTTIHRDTHEVRETHDVTGHDITSHPDAAEMDARYAKVLQGPRVTAVDGLIMLTGLYCAISPWVVHFQDTNTIMRSVNLVCGIALAVLGFGMAARPERLLQLGWAVSAIGVWLIVSPWVASLGHHGTRYVIWNNAFTGGAAVLLGLAAMGVLAAGGAAKSRSRGRATAKAGR